jgi:hypothetical protein
MGEDRSALPRRLTYYLKRARQQPANFGVVIHEGRYAQLFPLTLEKILKVRTKGAGHTGMYDIVGRRRGFIL